jgi:hypothetical protein
MKFFTKQTLKSFAAIAICSTTLTIATSVYAQTSTQPISTENAMGKARSTTIATKQIKPPFAIAQANGLTGNWSSNDGGTYYLRQIGNNIWWYGESGDGGKRWSNVFRGTISGNKIIGHWADVPKGSILGSGEMTLSISNGRLHKISGGENFGGSS